MTDHNQTPQDNRTPDNNRPFARHRDAGLEIAIWRRETEKGAVYNTDLKRSYKDEQGEWRTTHAIPERDLLKAARLQEQAYGTIQQAREHDRMQYIQQQKQQAKAAPNPEHPLEH